MRQRSSGAKEAMEDSAEVMTGAVPLLGATCNDPHDASSIYLAVIQALLRLIDRRSRDAFLEEMILSKAELKSSPASSKALLAAVEKIIRVAES